MRIHRGNVCIDLNDVGLIIKRSGKISGTAIDFYHKDPVVVDEEDRNGKFRKKHTHVIMATFFFDSDEEVAFAYSKIMDMLNSTQI